MEPRIRNRFRETMLQEALARYGSERLTRTLDGFESFVYEFERQGQPYILRITHSNRRDASLVQAEADWINYLADRGVSAAKAIDSLAGNLVEAIDDGQGEQFLATGFVKARGVPPWEATWTPILFETYGHLLGRMHALSQVYEPPPGHGRRFAWDDSVMQDVARNLPASESLAIERYRAVYDHVQSLPRDKRSYGLVHFDAHEANLFIDEQGHINLFDFDDCCYSWFIYDLAIVVFYMAVNQPDPVGFLHTFCPPFLGGYARENRLDPAWLSEIPHFLKLREIDLYGVIHRSFDVAHLEDQPWCATFMRDRKQRIEDGIPYLDYDWAALVRWL